MSILIIGDSFAGHGDPIDHYNVPSYQTLLRSEYNIHVDNYGFSGHAFYKAYEKLLEINLKIKNYKLIVFIITSPGRLYFSKPKFGIANIDQSERLLKQYENEFISNNNSEYPSFDEILSSLYYYKHLQNFKYEKFVHYIMEESLRNYLKENNIDHIIIPAFDFSFKQSINWSLFSMCLKQIELFSNSPVDCLPFNYTEIYGRILNHLTIENNEAMAEFIYQNYLGNNIIFDKKIFKPARIDDFYYYYEKS